MGAPGYWAPVRQQPWSGSNKKHRSSNKEKFTFNSAVRGYHVYKVVWKPVICERLQADQELDKEVDKFARKVIKNNEIVGHFPHEYLQILWYFIACGVKICVELTGRRGHCKQLSGGMETPCWLVLQVRVK